MLRRLVVPCLLLLCLPTTTFAQWAPGGAPIPGTHTLSFSICPDGQAGLFAGSSGGISSIDVNAQRLTASGQLAPGFPPSGVPVCTDPADQYIAGAVPDLQGGAILFWQDYRGIPSVYALRIDAQGNTVPGWVTNGTRVSLSTVENGVPGAIPDGSGGAFFVWDEVTNGSDEIHALHVLGDGTVAPDWPAATLTIAASPGSARALPLPASDGGGGFLVAWIDYRNGTRDVYAERLTAAGAPAAGWPSNGVLVASNRLLRTAVSDGSGGMYLGLSDLSTQVSGEDTNLYILRLTGSGQLAPGWVDRGNLVCDASFVRDRFGISSGADGSVVGQWVDYRGHVPSKLYAVRLMPDGSFATGWPQNGVRVSTVNDYQTECNVLADGQGGAYCAFATPDQVWVQHLGSQGLPAAGWTLDGTLLTPLTSQQMPQMISDDSGGALVVWENIYQGSLYAQHIVLDGVVATNLSLMSADAEVDRVSLLWQGEAAAYVNAAVERRTTSSQWERIGAPQLEGTDRLRYEDRNVTPGARYGYRLSYSEGTAQNVTSETWVDVPRSAVFSLEGARPNPAVGRMSVAFSLPDDSAASLALLDVTGRVLLLRDVGSLGAGQHVLPIGAESAVPPGLYWLRLTQGSRELTARVVMIR